MSDDNESESVKPKRLTKPKYFGTISQIDEIKKTVPPEKRKKRFKYDVATGRPAMSLQQLKLERILETGSAKTIKDAMIMAGYKTRYAAKHSTRVVNNPVMQAAILRSLDRIGVNDDYLAHKHKELLEASKTVSTVTGRDAGSSDVDFVDVPDFQSRAKGLDMAYKLRGDYAAEKHAIATNATTPTESSEELVEWLKIAVRK